jgi:UDP-galactopyranose mutase
MEDKQILVVGCGFAGATIARILAENGYRVDIIDQRNHIGGNCYDSVNEHGIRIHKYGAHIFHTNNEKVFNWLSNFTEWIEYKHKVKAMLYDGSLVVFPPTIDFQQENSKEKIFNIFYKPYTEKMWEIEVDDSILKRVPLRTDNSDLYFPNDKFQFFPKLGYTRLFENILNHKNINVYLNTMFDKSMEDQYTHVFNSMSIDVYYDYCYGELPYRSIIFNDIHLPQPNSSHCPVINFTHYGKETRVIEWKNFPNHGTIANVTTLTYETPVDYKKNNNERYYPIKDREGKNRIIYDKYKSIPNKKVTFIGRCGMYVYIDIDQAIASSMETAKKFIQGEKYEN